MRKSCLFLLVVAALVLAPAAAAKGPSEATVTGPGLDQPLVLGGGENDGTPVMNLAMNGGFFPAAYGARVGMGGILGHKPTNELGPKYTITYTVPTGSDVSDTVHQDLYPYARPVPYTYMPAGQTIFDMNTSGGWYAGTRALKDTLVTAGLPRLAPHVAAGSGHTLAWVIAGLVAAAAVIVITLRRSSIGRWFPSRSTSATKAPSV